MKDYQEVFYHRFSNHVKGYKQWCTTNNKEVNAIKKHAKMWDYLLLIYLTHEHVDVSKAFFNPNMLPK